MLIYNRKNYENREKVGTHRIITTELLILEICLHVENCSLYSSFCHQQFAKLVGLPFVLVSCLFVCECHTNSIKAVPFLVRLIASPWSLYLLPKQSI